MRLHPTRAAAPAVLALALAPAAAHATSLTVSNPANSGQGSLRALVAGANDNDTIVVPDPRTLPGAPTSYKLTSGEIAITKAIAIQGAGARSVTIDADGTGRVFRVTEPTGSARATISGLTLTGGTGTGGGFTARGGAVLVTKGSLVLTGSALVGNHVVATGSTLGHGGALDVDDQNIDASALLNQDLVAHNTLSVVDGNGFGGGLSATYELSVLASTLTDNTVTSTGAGLARGGGVATYADDGNVDHMAAGAQFSGATIARNAVVKSGSGNANGGNLFSNALAPVGLKVTIVTGGDATTGGEDCGGSPITTDGTNIIATTDTTCPSGTADLHVLPKLESQLRDYGGPTDVLRPQDGSPALGHAHACADQRQVLFTPGAACDTGAYQRIPGTAFTSIGTVTSPTSAHLTGSVTTLGPNPRAFFEYGPDDAHLTATPPQPLIQGSSVPVAADVDGLSPSTFYVFRTVVQSDDATGRADESAFQTDQAPITTTTTTSTTPPPDPGPLPTPTDPLPTTLPPDTTPHLAPGLFGSKVSPSKPRRGTKPTLTVKLTGTDPATIVVTLEHARTGHKQGSHCKAGSGHGKRCTTYVAVGKAKTLKDVTTSASLTLPKLGSGSYRLQLKATTTAGKTGSLTLSFSTRA